MLAAAAQTNSGDSTANNSNKFAFTFESLHKINFNMLHIITLPYVLLMCALM